jgi:thioredoxin reductase
MESWRRYMPEGMILKSERFASNLWDQNRRFTLERYSAEKGLSYQPVGHPLSLATFLEYAEWFRGRTEVESRDVRVVQIRHNANHFYAQLADGTSFTSRRVILATGHMPFRRIPTALSRLAEPLLVHTTGIRDVKAYAGRDVTIIGGGQSALETAALLHEAGARIRIFMRGSGINWNSPSKPRSPFARILAPDAGIGSGWKSWSISELPRLFRHFPPDKRHRFVAHSYGPGGAWWLRDRVGHQIELRLNCVVENATAENSHARMAVRGPDGQSDFVTDHVIAGTGFMVDVDRLEYLDAGLRRSIARERAGVPALTSHFETSMPGLFIVGVASSPVFGPIMRFMYGAKHVAPLLTRYIKSTA